MPHFIIDCSEQILEIEKPKIILEEMLKVVYGTGLFEKSDIKIRLNPFKYSLVQESNDDFIHVFGNIMEGRSDEQKANLSKLIITKLKLMFPNVPIISINIRDFEKASYCNKNMVS